MEHLMLPNEQESKPEQVTEYSSIIWGLQFLANNTRPDIAFAVNHLARFLIYPSSEHLQAAFRVLRYIAKEPDRGIKFYRTADKTTIEAYTDADFAADPSTSR